MGSPCNHARQMRVSRQFVGQFGACSVAQGASQGASASARSVLRACDSNWVRWYGLEMERIKLENRMCKQRRALITHQHLTFPVRLSQSIIDFTPVLIIQYLIANLLLRRLSHKSRRSPLLWTKQSGPSQKMPPYSTP